MQAVLLDSSFLYALFQKADRRHHDARQLSEANPLPVLVPDVVLPEVSFLLARDGGVPAVTTFLAGIQSAGLRFEGIIEPDIERARLIMLNYQDSYFDFVDCIVMSMAERLDIRQVATFDRRDFSIFRPTHCDYLELLP